MASPEQKDLMRQYHDHTGFEFMGKDEVKANDPQGFIFAWKKNIQWLEDVAHETDRMIDDYKDRHID